MWNQREPARNVSAPQNGVKDVEVAVPRKVVDLVHVGAECCRVGGAVDAVVDCGVISEERVSEERKIRHTVIVLDLIADA